MTFVPRFIITNRMTAAITQIERARDFLEAARLSDDWLRDIKRLFTISEYYDRARPTFHRSIQGVREKGMIKEMGAGPTDPTRHYVLSEL